MNLYSVQYIAMILLLDKIFTMSLELAKKSKEIYSKFLRFNEELIRFINNHQFIKGFQIATKDFYKADSRIIGSIDEYISIQQTTESEPQYETIELKDILDDNPVLFVSSSTDIRKRTNYDSIYDKNSLESPMERIKKDEYFQNVFKSEYNVDEIQYNDIVLKPVKESTQNTKKHLASVVGSDKRRIFRSPIDKNLKLSMKNCMDITKKPILMLGTLNEEKPSSTPKKTIVNMNFGMNSNILENNSKNNSGSRNSRLNSTSNSVIKRERKKSMIPFRRKTGIGQCESFDFEPDFDDAIFETFPNNYSQDFKVDKIWTFKDDGNCSNSTQRTSVTN